MCVLIIGVSLRSSGWRRNRLPSGSKANPHHRICRRNAQPVSGGPPAESSKVRWRGRAAALGDTLTVTADTLERIRPPGLVEGAKTLPATWFLGGTATTANVILLDTNLEQVAELTADETQLTHAARPIEQT
jgi:hypothetical protein